MAVTIASISTSSCLHQRSIKCSRLPFKKSSKCHRSWPQNWPLCGIYHQQCLTKFILPYSKRHSILQKIKAAIISLKWDKSSALQQYFQLRHTLPTEEVLSTNPTSQQHNILQAAQKNHRGLTKTKSIIHQVKHKLRGKGGIRTHST